MSPMKNKIQTHLSDPPLSGGTVSHQIETARRTSAALLLTTLALGIIRKRYPHLVDAPVSSPSISERRDILNLLLKMTDSQTVNLAGRDHVIDLAIDYGRTT